MDIIDFHTHTFPDDLAARAIASLMTNSPESRNHTDGTISGLLKSMENSGIKHSVVLPVATKPSQVPVINQNSLRLKCKQITAFGALHPQTPNVEQEIAFLKENNIPVIIANPLSLPLYEHSDVRMPFKLAAIFKKEGILTGLTYSSQAYANLPFAAGQTVAYGLTKEEALQTVTLNNAKILAIDDVTGSLEPGKDANIIVSTGDLLDMKTNNVELAFITGRNISLDNKHKQLTRRFQAKYDDINSNGEK